MPTSMNEYQQKALQTFSAGNEETRNELIARIGFGLCGETGEVAEAIKKYLRGDYDIRVLAHKMSSELGDIVWYVAVMAELFQMDLETVVSENVKKLASRQQRGVIKGSGDNR